MSVLILLKSYDEARVYQVKDSEEARYWFLRCVEKEGWQADRGFIVEEEQALPLEQWAEEDWQTQRRLERERTDRQERADYERLKKKFERENK